RQKTPVRQVRAGNGTATGSLAFSPDGKLLAAASDRMWLYNVADGSLCPPLEQPAGPWILVDCLAFSPDGRYLLATTAARPVVHRWDIASGKVVPTGVGGNFDLSARMTPAVHAVAFSPDHRTLAVGLADRTVELWDLDTAQQ